MSVNQRIKSIIDSLEDGKQSAFAAKVGVSPTVVGTFMPGGRESKPGFEVLAKMIEAYPQLRIEWLILGEEPMLKKTNPIKEYTKGTVARLEEQEIPLFEHKASAGLTKLFSNSENVLDYIKVPNLPKCDGAVHISGDSMYPLLKSGDIVMYKQIHNIEQGIFWGEMYLVSLNLDDEDYTLVKYIQKSDLGNDYVKLVSQNEYHAPKDVPLKSIRALGYIKASIRINSMA